MTLRVFAPLRLCVTLLIFYAEKASAGTQSVNLGAIKPPPRGHVVLDRDDMTISLEEIRYIRAVATIVGGDLVYASESWR